MSLSTHGEKGDAKKRDAQYSTALKAGAKASAGGLAVFGPGAYFLHRTWRPWAGLTLPLKTMFVTMATLATGVIAADKAGIAFDQEHYNDEGALKMRQFQTREERQWSELSRADRILTWTKDNKFTFVIGSWLATMTGVFAVIHNQPMTLGQKAVQARVWAQGVTLASVLSMAAVTQIPTAGDKILKERSQAGEHSWRDFVEDSDEDQREREQARKALSKKQQQQNEKKSSSKIGKKNEKAQSDGDSGANGKK